jgi:hypothetical protein
MHVLRWPQDALWRNTRFAQLFSLVWVYIGRERYLELLCARGSRAHSDRLRANRGNEFFRVACFPVRFNPFTIAGSA